MHVVASAPSPQRGSKWHRQALPSLERFLLISVFGNGNAPRAQSLGAAAPEACEEDHIHLHLCFNSASLFHKRGLGALDIFAFEGVSPHVVPNKASGGAYAGAVRHGHFYVVADKVGTVFNWTDFEPFVAYAVEAWWLDNLLKHEKLSHKVYLAYAARVGVGFQRRLGGVRAAEQYLEEQAMRDLVEEEQAAVSGNGNAPKARLRKLAKRSCSLALVLPLCITLPQERPWRLGHLRFRGNLSARGAEQG